MNLAEKAAIKQSHGTLDSFPLWWDSVSSFLKWTCIDLHSACRWMKCYDVFEMFWNWLKITHVFILLCSWNALTHAIASRRFKYAQLLEVTYRKDTCCRAALELAYQLASLFPHSPTFLVWLSLDHEQMYVFSLWGFVFSACLNSKALDWVLALILFHV